MISMQLRRFCSVAYLIDDLVPGFSAHDAGLEQLIKQSRNTDIIH